MAATDRNSVDAAVVVVGYADTPSGPFKYVVCEIDSSAALSRNEIAETTKCGTLKKPGQQNNTFSGNMTIVTDQDGTEASHTELIGLYAAGTRKYWTFGDPDENIFIGGYAYLTQYNPSAPAEGFVKASFTVSIDGDIDTTPQS